MTNSRFQNAGNSAALFPFDDIFYEEEDDIKRQELQHEKTFEDKEISLESRSVEEKESSQRNNKGDKKCLNHNFQKHAVVTVKKLMRMKYNINGSDAEKLAHKMWTIFMASTIKSKKILVVLFGSVTLSDKRDVNLFKMCGFQEVLDEQQSLIRKAQQILRVRFNEMVSDVKVWENIKQSRNIKAEEEFYAYFTELLRLIREGPFQKFRINDKTSKKIQEDISSKTLSQFDQQN